MEIGIHLQFEYRTSYKIIEGKFAKILHKNDVSYLLFHEFQFYRFDLWFNYFTSTYLIDL